MNRLPTPGMERCTYCGVEYPKPVSLHHSTEECHANEVENIARVAHEVNRAYCQALGDNSQPAWEQAPDWQRSSAINGATYHINFPDAGPDASHNQWFAEKVANGWKYGLVKDPEKKEHPCMVPFAELPTEQKAKDFLFRAVVHALRG